MDLAFESRTQIGVGVTTRLEQLLAASRALKAAEAAQLSAVRQLRAAGVAWSVIARYSGMLSKGAAFSRFSRLLEGPSRKVTGHPRPDQPRLEIPTGSMHPLVLCGRAEKLLRKLPDAVLDAVVTDPPFEIGLAEQAWDLAGVSYDVAVWSELLRVVKPGGVLMCFAAPRTGHRVAGAIEGAGWEIKDVIAILRSHGVPKGTALKPSHDQVIIARRPLPGSSALKLNVDAARIPTVENWARGPSTVAGALGLRRGGGAASTSHPGGRYPGNVLFEHSLHCDDATCMPGCAVAGLERQAAGAQRFFYSARVAPSELPRTADGLGHLSVKRLSVMDWVVGLAAGEGEVILDPFAGSGSTIESAMRLRVRAIAFEADQKFIPLIEERMLRQQARALVP